MKRETLRCEGQRFKEAAHNPSHSAGLGSSILVLRPSPGADAFGGVDMPLVIPRGSVAAASAYPPVAKRAASDAQEMRPQDVFLLGNY